MARLMMWWMCRQEVGRPAGQSGGKAAAAWRPQTRLTCLCSKRWEDPTAISGCTFISAGRSSQAEPRFKWNRLLLFFSLSKYRFVRRCSDNNIIQTEFHPQEHFSLPCRVVSLMCVIPRGSGGDNRGDLLCSTPCRLWEVKPRAEHSPPPSTADGVGDEDAKPQLKWSFFSPSLNGLIWNGNANSHAASLNLCRLRSVRLSDKIIRVECSFL